MKKAIIFIGIILSVGLFAFFNQVQGETTTTLTTSGTMTTTTLNSVDFEENLYYYTDYQDLINQIYADVHDDIYDQIYSEVIDELTDAFYEEIYETIEAQLVDLLSIDELELYVDDFQHSSIV